MNYLYHKKSLIVLIIFLSLPVALMGQNAISLDSCIKQALERNYYLKMARNEEAMAENNVSLSPFLPKVAASGNQELTNYTKEDTDSPAYSDKTNAFTANVGLSWKLFDGLAMFTNYSRQKQLFALSSQNVKIEVENLIMKVCTEYYNIIVQQHILESELTTLSLSKSRYANAEEKYLLGVISGLDLQQAKLDLNADSSRVLLQRETVRSAYISFANLLNAGQDKKYLIHDTILLSQELNYDSLKIKTLANNNTLIKARQGEIISKQDLSLVRAARYPTLSFSTGYDIGNSTYPKRTVDYYNYYGPYYGFSINWNIFSGMENRRKITNAKLETENSKLAYLDAENEIFGELSLLYNNYRNNIIVTSFEMENTEVAAKTLEIAMDRYRLGSLSGLEFREYQNKYIEAVNRRLTALYQAKMSEIGLRLLCGELTE